MRNLTFMLITEQEFKYIENNFLNSSYFQTVSWGGLKSLTGWSSFFVAVYDGEKFVAASLLLSKNVFFGKKIFYAPRGFLCDFNDFDLLEFFTINIKKFVKANGGFLFKMDPLISYCDRDLNGNVVGENNNMVLVKFLKSLGYKHMGFTTGFSNDIQFRWSFYLNLDKSYNLFDGMDKRCKRCIRKSDIYPYVVREVDDSNLSDFKSIMEHTCNRHNCYDRSLDYYVQIMKSFREKAKLLIIYLVRDEFLKSFECDKLYDKIKMDNRDFIPVTAGVFIVDSNSLHYVYGGTFKDYMAFNFQYKMQFLMINYALSNNLSVYDFGGISGDFNKDSKSYGIYEFKRGFGGYVVEYIGEFDLVVNYIDYLLYRYLFRFYSVFKSFVLNVKKKTEVFSFYRLPCLLVSLVGIFLLLYLLHK